jgi:hypothetical protein
MGKIMDKIKEKLMGDKDKVRDAGEAARDKMETGSSTERTSTGSRGSAEYKEDVPPTDTERKDDPLKSYKDKEPMTPAKIKEHEPTAVKREMTEKIVEPEKQRSSPDPKQSKEIARNKEIAKGTADKTEARD